MPVSQPNDCMTTQPLPKQETQPAATVALWQPAQSWQFLRKLKQFFHSALVENILLGSGIILITPSCWEWWGGGLVNVPPHYLSSVNIAHQYSRSWKEYQLNIWSGKCLTAIFYCNERKNEFLLEEETRSESQISLERREWLIETTWNISGLISRRQCGWFSSQLWLFPSQPWLSDSSSGTRRSGKKLFSSLLHLLLLAWEKSRHRGVRERL